ncbi:MAG: Type secretion system protein TadC, associated with Flp pilus assembly [Ilumatobacteraceae bacterium]|nr:Type secretion system protein TadC, associated with Flp pilus assembly [Ilumatobacteraceae bacterium]
MEPRVVTSATACAIAAGCLARALVRQPRPLASRVQPYASGLRGRLGTIRPESGDEGPNSSQAGFTLVFGPFVRGLSAGLARLVDASASTSAELRLRQAGLSMTAEQYRTRQLAYTVGAFAAGAFFGLLLGRSAGTVVLLSGAAALWGATRWRARVDKMITKRRERMRSEMYTVCQLIAIYLRTGDTPAGAVDRLVRRANGEVVSELAEASAQVRAGNTATFVFEQLTSTTPEPSAARLYRVLSSTWTAGGDADALLALADDMRASRREDLSRLMTKRETAMALPLVLVIGPILILFVAAAIPHIVFGR